MPTGVHLSDGWTRTSSNWELFLTGIAIMGLGAVSMVVAYLLVWILDGYTEAPAVALLMGLVATPELPRYAYVQTGINLLVFTCFLIVLHLSPMSGYHAAEHMTVTAIERFGRLDPDLVRQMPRAHARCGTTLLAGILPALLISASLWPVHPEISAPIAVLGWTMRQPVGWALQQYLTTKPPTPRQLEAGLRAGRAILEAHKKRAHKPQSPAESLWSRGMLQMAAGVVVAMYILGLVYDKLHLWLDW